ncbi:hypothetical protein [Bradyrhizobium symbiodeficiens]|uniref:hypothetical protein n=1 Tax=Bradyrhizobium symbiodeficiens TaxID=1404367 RepID=UPI0011E4D2D3|nr:hypothetical protein [Bradyrhizobium symbiodeficiens]
MIQATIENKYRFDMQVLAAPMAGICAAGTATPEAGGWLFFVMLFNNLNGENARECVRSARYPAIVRTASANASQICYGEPAPTIGNAEKFHLR